VRVLVIEDEPDLRRALVQSLREEGYAADQAADGAEGLFKATGCDYEAVVLDLMLPGMDGLEVLRRLRLGRKTPVLILTARDGVGDRVRGLDAGADDYLVKPFALSELLARLRALIRRSAGQADPALRVGDVTIDTATRTVTRSGRPVPLTAREYALVELLALRRGKLITRTVIYDQLFGDDDDTLSNVVEVHVSHIRKKLGKDFIQTRRGQGYLVDGSEAAADTDPDDDA
jgi:two-component system, OmpR family, response regulator